MSNLAAYVNPCKPYALFSGTFGSGCVCYILNAGTTTPFYIPTGVCCLRARVWGAGGGYHYCCCSSCCEMYFAGSGGGFAMKTFAVVPGCCCTVTVGAAGAYCTNGGASSFGSVVSATGGCFCNGTPGTGVGGDINRCGGAAVLCCWCNSSSLCTSKYRGGGAANYFGDGNYSSGTGTPGLSNKLDLLNLDYIGTGGVCFDPLSCSFTGAVNGGGGGQGYFGSFPGGGSGSSCQTNCYMILTPTFIGHGLVVIEW